MAEEKQGGRGTSRRAQNACLSLWVPFLLAVAVGVLAVVAPKASTASDVGEAAEAAAPGPSGEVELPGQRTATSDTFRLSNGSRETRVYTAPVNYRSEGEWQPIEEELRQRPNGEIENGANSFELTLPARLGDGASRLSVGEDWVSAQLLGQTTAPAEVEGSMATYQGAEGANFELASEAAGLKETIELESAAAPSTYHYALSASSGLEPTLEEDGSIVFRDESGSAIVVLPAPTVSDSSAGAVSTTGPASYRLQPSSNGGWGLDVEVERSWLEAPNRVWPVRLDPPLFAKESISLDCQYFVKEPSGETNSTETCGSTGATELKAEYAKSGTVTSRYRSAIKFNLSSIPKDAWIESASVNLYDSEVATGLEAVQLRRATQPWTSRLNWTYYFRLTANKGSKWTTPGGDFTEEGSELSTSERELGTKAGLWTFSKGMAPLVSGWVQGTTANDGLIVKLANEKSCESTCSHGRFAFKSSAAANSEAQRPYLSATYYTPAHASSKVVLPTEGTSTARRLRIKASWEDAGVTSATFQYREGKTGYFQEIPAELVTESLGNHAAHWPLVLSGEKTTGIYYVEAAHLSTTLRKKGGPIQIRALLEGPTGVAGYTAPVEASVDRYMGGAKDATAEVGPGTVNLLTGNLSISQTDVSIPTFNNSLTFSRTFNSREAGKTGDKGVLGQGWKPGLPVEEAGSSEWRGIKLEAFEQTIEGETYKFAYALVTGLEGAELAFEREEGSETNFITPPELTGWILSKSGGTFTLKDPEGTITSFEQVSGGGEEYVPKRVSLPGGGNGVREFWAFAGEQKRLTGIVAPSPGLACETEAEAFGTEGCRALFFSYEPASDWGAPSSYGERLSEIFYYSGFTPDIAVERYVYNSEGRLKEAFDPRISPH